jgi:type II secretory pathway component GspD/PulD (secretin)
VENEDMKTSLLLISIIFCTCFLTSVCAIGETASGDELISLNVEQRPLDEVLAMITKMTGHAFVIDDQWLDMPVSISVKSTPLHKVLKFIFADINNAIIYKSDGNIKIIVYSEPAQKDKGSASQQSASPPETASSPETEQESESSQEAAPEPEAVPEPEAAPEPETDNLADTAEEAEAQAGEEQESAEEQTETTAEETAQEQADSSERVSD